MGVLHKLEKTWYSFDQNKNTYILDDEVISYILKIDSYSSQYRFDQQYRVELGRFVLELYSYGDNIFVFLTELNCPDRGIFLSKRELYHVIYNMYLEYTK